MKKLFAFCLAMLLPAGLLTGCAEQAMETVQKSFASFRELEAWITGLPGGDVFSAAEAPYYTELLQSTPVLSSGEAAVEIVFSYPHRAGKPVFAHDGRENGVNYTVRYELPGGEITVRFRYIGWLRRRKAAAAAADLFAYRRAMKEDALLVGGAERAAEIGGGTVLCAYFAPEAAGGVHRAQFLWKDLYVVEAEAASEPVLWEGLRSLAWQEHALQTVHSFLTAEELAAWLFDPETEAACGAERIGRLREIPLPAGRSGVMVFSSAWVSLSAVGDAGGMRYVHSGNIVEIRFYPIPEENAEDARMAAGDIRRYGAEGKNAGTPMSAVIDLRETVCLFRQVPDPETSYRARFLLRDRFVAEVRAESKSKLVSFLKGLRFQDLQIPVSRP